MLKCAYLYFLRSAGYCSHIVGLMYTLDLQRGQKEVSNPLSCTSMPQMWHKPRGKTIQNEPVPHIKPLKAKLKRKRKVTLRHMKW